MAKTKEDEVLDELPEVSEEGVSEVSVLFYVNTVCFIAVLALSLLPCACGHVLGLGHNLSVVIILSVFALALSAAGLMMIRGPGRDRFYGFLLFGVYIIYLMSMT